MGEGRVASGEQVTDADASSTRPVFRLVALACAFAALAMTFAGLVEFDVPLTRFVRTLNDIENHLRNPWLAQLSDVGDQLGKGESLVALSLVLVAAGHGLRYSLWKAAGWDTLVAHGIVGLINNLVKHLIGRARPKFMHAGSVELSPLSGNGWDSFPSGHAMSSFAVATVLAVKFPRVRYAILCVACTIAASRILRGSHYLTDVAAGVLLGHLIGSVAAHSWREWKSSLESALFVLTPPLVALLAVVWTIGHRPSDVWPAPQLIALGVASVLLGLAGRMVLLAQPAKWSAWYTRSLLGSLVGLGVGMVTGSAWVTATVLLACAAHWLRSVIDEEEKAPHGEAAGSIVNEALFAFTVASALVLAFALRGALPML
jgi:membrane-associated phospholipid phosphatase